MPLSLAMSEALTQVSIVVQDEDETDGGHIALRGSDSYDSVIKSMRRELENDGWTCTHDATQTPMDTSDLRMARGGYEFYMNVGYDDTMEWTVYRKEA